MESYLDGINSLEFVEEIYETERWTERRSCTTSVVVALNNLFPKAIRELLSRHSRLAPPQTLLC